MTAPAGTFAVGRDQWGRTEAEWASSEPLRAVPALELPVTSHVVVVAPHPDDEILGAGGLLQSLHGRGADVDVVAVTDGEAAWGPLDAGAARGWRDVRAAEATEAMRRLGLDPRRRHRLGLPDGGGPSNAGAVHDWLARHLRPGDLVVAPWPAERHPDHDAAGAAAAGAARAAGVPCLHYLVWTWHWADPAGGDVPWPTARRHELTAREITGKHHALAAFVSQLQPRGDRPGELPVLPPELLPRFRRPWEVFLT